MAALAENFEADLLAACGKTLGFEPQLRFTPEGEIWVEQPSETFVIPTALELTLWEREAMGQRIADARRAGKVLFHDDVDVGHPLVVEALAHQAARALGDLAPQKCGFILAASGHGDPASRAQSYRLMRLLWEQCGFARGEVGFVRHVQPFLGHVLEQSAKHTTPSVIVFQSQWETEHVQYARVMAENVRGGRFYFADPPGAHPLMTAWLAQRIARLWQERRARSEVRAPSAKNVRPAGRSIHCYGAGLIARATDRELLEEALDKILPQDKFERVLVKVTWHGYATGTYTDAAALDLLLSALPAPAVVMEGHTTSRNLGGAAFDWETEAKQNRGWIRQQEAEYLRRSGIQEVLARRRAEYLNVTEEFWDEDEPGDPARFVPRRLIEFRGCPMVTFAKFKGPTRLGISNMFGLIPPPLRSAWHGPNITWFARTCCRIAKTYGEHFELCGLVEGLYSAVRWNRRGLYRSRWGNYDLIRDAGYITASRGLAPADILAARLQGQDVARSAFFDVVREELGWDREAAEAPLPEEAKLEFV
jgi:hypothetical protein